MTLDRDDIEAIADAVFLRLSGQGAVAFPRQPLSVAQQAIQLARQGKHEESKLLLKSASKRRAAA